MSNELFETMPDLSSFSRRLLAQIRTEEPSASWRRAANDELLRCNARRDKWNPLLEKLKYDRVERLDYEVKRAIGERYWNWFIQWYMSEN
jgi:hypothetical protein